MTILCSSRASLTWARPRTRPRAADILHELETEIDKDDGNAVGFAMKRDPETSPGALWIYSDGSGEPEHVIRFVLRYAEVMDLTGLWGFTWGLSCSRPRLDGFGGGAQILDLGKRETIDWIDCSNWVSERTTPNTDDTMLTPVETSAGQGAAS